MPSLLTRSILKGVHGYLYDLINRSGPDVLQSIVKQRVALAKLQYKAWEDSYKLESTDRPQYAYANLLEEDKVLDNQVNWYFVLLDAWIARGEGR